MLHPYGAISVPKPYAVADFPYHAEKVMFFDRDEWRENGLHSPSARNLGSGQPPAQKPLSGFHGTSIQVGKLRRPNPPRAA
jgi:hypothetical protein